MLPAISGKEYLERINKLNSEIWIDGKKVEGEISNHPAFKGVMKSQAKLYDLQVDPKNLELMTYTLPNKSERVGTSYLEPKTKEDLEKRRLSTQIWAKSNLGMMGRSPDYMNTALMAVSSAANLLIKDDDRFAKNLRNYYELARAKDYSFTHTFINPQVNRSEYALDNYNEIISAQIVDKNKDGIVIHGARLLATQGGITDEIIVFPSGGKFAGKELAYAFAIPSNTKGLKFICRESFAYRDSKFDHPLASQFEEMDTLIVFDHVLVPWERVFICEDLELANKIYPESSFFPLVLHQVISRQVIKMESLIGIAQLMVDTINIGEYQHVQGKISELITGYETMKALLLASEVNATIDKWGTMTPDINPLYSAIISFPRMYPRYTEIIQLLGGSGLVSIPTENDFHSPVKSDLDSYLQATSSNAYDRVKLFRLAWDLSMSAFGGRQTLYERFFFGDPVRLSGNQYRAYDRSKFVEHIKNFLKDKE